MANQSILAAFDQMWQHVVAKVGTKADIDHTHDAATTSANGFMSSTDKTKLDGIEDTYMTKANPTGTGSFSMNRKADTTVGTNSVAEGINATASGAYSHAEGYNTTAEGDCSHAEGGGSAAIGDYSHAEGTGSIVEGTSSHAEGYYTVVTGNYSHAEGRSTTAEGDYSHAEGDNTVAKGDYSHAEGNNTLASGESSHAEGDGTEANGSYSHAEGYNTTAFDLCSHAEGYNTTTSGLSAHAEGYGTIASSDYQHVQGKYNTEDANNTYAFIIGNGTSDTDRSNAMAVDWEGSVKVAKDLIALGGGISTVTGHFKGAVTCNGSLTANNGLTATTGTFNGSVTCNNAFTAKSAVELYGATPYIDFHFGNNTGDYTSRIIESASGTLRINGVDFKDSDVYAEHFCVPNNYAFRAYASDGTTLRAMMYMSAEDNINIGQYSDNGHTGNTYVNSVNGIVYLRNRTTTLAFTNNSGDSYAGAFWANPAASDGKVLLGGTSHRWYKVYAASNTIGTSDEREKSDIMSIADYPVMYSRDGEGNVFEQLFDKLVPKTYTLDIENTNEIHIGFVAQDISKSMEELGLTEEDLGLIDHEYWTDEETGEEKDRYGLAYSEFAALNTYMIQKLKKRVSEQDEKIAELESKFAELKQ